MPPTQFLRGTSAAGGGGRAKNQKKYKGAGFAAKPLGKTPRAYFIFKPFRPSEALCLFQVCNRAPQQGVDIRTT